MACAVFVCAFAGDGRAQSTPGQAERERPADEAPESVDPMSAARRRHTALFGGASVEREPANGLRLSATTFLAWDDNLLAELAGPPTTSVVKIGGAYTNAGGELTYHRRSTRLQVAANAGGNTRYYTNVNRFAANDVHSALGVSVRPNTITALALTQTFSYAPVFLYGLFVDAMPTTLGGAAPVDSAFAVNDDRALTTDSRLEFDRRLSTRSLVRAEGGYRRSHYTVVTARGTDFSTLDAGADYRYRVTEDGDFRLGYSYRRASYIGAIGVQPPQPIEHNAHVGVAFHPALSQERRTIINFEAGTSLVSSPISTDAFVSRRQVRLVGDAAIAHQTGRTWLTVAAFKRGTGFIQGLSGPVFTDSLSLTSTGFVNARTDLRAALGYSNGEPSLVGSAVNFTTATAEFRVRVALNAHWAFSGEYIFYRYDFTDVLPLTSGLDPRVKRNTLRAGVSVWLPVRR